MNFATDLDRLSRAHVIYATDARATRERVDQPGDLLIKTAWLRSSSRSFVPDEIGAADEKRPSQATIFLARFFR